MGRRRYRRAEPGLGDAVGEVLAGWMFAGPLGAAGTGLFFLVVGVWMWREGNPFVPEIATYLGGFFAGVGGVTIFGAAVWAWWRSRRRTTTGGPPSAAPQLHAAGPGASAAAPAGPRDGAAFERAVAAYFRARGYDVEETGTHGTGGDGGIDLVLRRPSDPAAAAVCVQCKDYANWAVGVERVRAFAGAVALRGPGHVGMIITTSRFTADAVRDAAGLGIRLVDGAQWNAMRDGAPPPAAPAASAPGPAPLPPPPAAATTAPPVPLCRACGLPMIRRDPRPGGKAFRPFWGCANYPRCRQTVDIA